MRISLYRLLFSFLPVGACVVVSESLEDPALYSGSVCELLGASSAQLVELYSRPVNFITACKNKLYIIIGE